MMKAFGYLIAGAALFTTAVAQVKPPAPNSSLGNGWRYKGCYSDTASTNASPHALQGSFTRINPNGGAQCTTICRGQGYKFAGTSDNQCWCGNVINPSNSAIAGVLSPSGDASCTTSCRGNLNEACGALDTFISIYEYTVSGFLINACVPMLVLLCSLFVFYGGSGERPIERSAEESTGGDQMDELAGSEGETEGGGVRRALMTGHRRLRPLDFFGPLRSRQTINGITIRKKDVASFTRVSEYTNNSNV